MNDAAPGASMPFSHNHGNAVLPNLDGVRALACLMVVVSHMPIPTQFDTLGELGVGVFFVLSGFLMGHLYLGHTWTTQSVVRYSIARFARIAPIYWVVILACIAISYSQPNDEFLLRIEGPVAIARHLLFGGNVFVFWSIPLEVQYYIFFIFVWWGVATRGKRVFALPVLVISCVILLVTITHWPGLMLPHKLHFFLVGTLAGICPRPVWKAGFEQGLLSIIQIVALCILVSPLWIYSSKSALYEATALGLALAVCIYFLSIPSKWTGSVFATAWVRKIGQASFSIYLVHILVFYFGMKIFDLHRAGFEWWWVILGLAGVTIPMFVSHYIELPLQRITRRFMENKLLVDAATPHGFVKSPVGRADLS